MVEKLKKIKHILIINNFNIKLMNDFYILFLKIWVSLSCFFFTKKKIKTLNLDNKNKIKILLDPMNGFVDKFIYTKKKWDEVNTKIIIKNLKKSHCFIDVGSNTGYFSLLASPIVGKKGKIIAIEPIKKSEQVKIVVLYHGGEPLLNKLLLNVNFVFFVVILFVLNSFY